MKRVHVCDIYRLPSEGSQTVLSPVVSCGPSGMLLNRPVALTLPHCAQLDTPTPDWTLTLKTQTHQGAWEVREPHAGIKWWMPSLFFCSFFVSLIAPFIPVQEVLTVGEETLSSPCYLQLEEECCHVLMEQLGTYGLVGQSCPPQPACKRLQLALFAPRAPCLSLDYSLRIYCIHDTPHALKVLLSCLCICVGLYYCLLTCTLSCSPCCLPAISCLCCFLFICLSALPKHFPILENIPKLIRSYLFHVFYFLSKTWYPYTYTVGLPKVCKLKNK